MADGAATRYRRAAVVAILAVLAVLLWRFAREPDEAGEAAPHTPDAAAPAARSRAVRFGTGRQRVALSEAERTVEEGIGHMRGVVLSQGDGRGVAGARLTFASPTLHSVTADAEGRFDFAPPHEGSYELALVEAEGFLPFAPEYGHSPMIFYARRGQGLSGARIHLTPAITYTALVVTPADEPVAGASIHVLGGRAPGASLAADGAPPPLTDEAGEALFSARDGAIVEARHPEWDPGRARLDFGVQVGQRMRIVLAPKGSTVPDDAVLHGRVLVDGEPEPDALVVARLQGEPMAAELVPEARATSDDEGRFALSGLRPGRYTVVASLPGYAPGIVRDVPAPGAVEIALSGGAALRGRVTDAASGAPIPSFAVIVHERRGPLHDELCTVEPTYDPEGRYEIPALYDGRFVVTASAHGYATSAEHEVTLAGRDVTVDVALQRGASIEGEVVDADSDAPIAGAKISLERWLGIGGDAVELYSAALSDEAGRFVLTGIGGGRQSLMVAATGHHGRLLGVDVPASGTQRVRVALTPVAEGEAPRIELTGIGAVLSAKDDALVIGRVIEGGGAEEAGLATDDAILAVDGAAVADLGFAGAIERIRGPEGSVVQLLVRRAGSDAAAWVAVVRRRIRG